jgi:hypothetical protein
MSSSRTLFLDSHAADGGDGEWTWRWPEGIDLGPRGARVELSLQLFSFYSTVPNIDARYNTLVRDSTLTYTVPAGQYDAARLAQTLEGLLLDISVAFDDNAMTFTFTGDTAFTLQGSLLTLLGWPSGDEAYASTAGGVLTSPGLINLGGTRYIEVSTSLPTDNIVNQDRSGLVLARLPVAGTYGELISYSGMDVSATCLERTLSALSITIRDDKGQPIPFTGTDWCMSLYFSATPDPFYKDIPEVYSLASSSNQQHDANNLSEKGPGRSDYSKEEHGQRRPNPDQGVAVRHKGT